MEQKFKVGDLVKFKDNQKNKEYSIIQRNLHQTFRITKIENENSEVELITIMIEGHLLSYLPTRFKNNKLEQLKERMMQP